MSELEQLRAELQAAREAIERRDALLAIIAHELRNPIAPVLLSLEALVLEAKHAANLERDHLIKRLEQCRRYALRLRSDLDRLLDFSRLRSGRIDLQPSEIDVSKLVGACIEDMAPMFDAAQCQVTTQLESPLPAVLDAMRLNQIIWNLLSNAIKYAPGARIEVETSSSGGELTIVVADHGPGIPADHQAAVCAQFERIEPHAHTGFGIGLWLVRNVVDAMGGTIVMTSAEGSGTRFEIKLPRGRS